MRYHFYPLPATRQQARACIASLLLLFAGCLGAASASAAPGGDGGLRLCPRRGPLPLLADTLRHGQLSGSLRDVAGKPVEFASVRLVQAADSTLVQAAQSDDQGRFSFGSVAPGLYRLHAQQLGYRDARSAVVQMGAASQQLPPLVLAAAPRQLGEVKVVGHPPAIERQTDRTILHVERMPALAGGTAFDIIKNAPGVTVTGNDAISMQGKSGVLVLIDDRPVRLSPEALLNMLRNMPAESVQSLEIITTPPAKYDAEGNAGILNLRTRVRQQPGWNADLTLRGAQGHYTRYGGGAVVGVRQKAVDLNGSYFLGRTPSFEDITQYATQHGPGQPQPQTLRTNTRTVNTAYYHDAKAQMDVKIGPRASAGLVASLYVLANPATGTGTNQTLVGPQASDTTLLTQSRRTDDSHNYSVDGYYLLRLDSVGRSISFDANIARFQAAQQQDFTNQAFDQPRGQLVGKTQQLNSLLAGHTNIASLKVDASLLLAGVKVETGLKYSQVAASNDFVFQQALPDGWQVDALRTNQFQYDEHIAAAYGSASREWAKVTVQVGLRSEYTRTLGTSTTTGTSTRNNYLRLFPTVYFQYKPSASYQLNLSYSRRIERPAYSSLNPFLSYQSRYFSNQGNPFLQPSFTDALEWTNLFAHDLTLTPFASYTSQFSSEYPLQNPATHETTYTFGNLGYAYAYGMTLVAPFGLGKNWKVASDLTAFAQEFHSTIAAEPQTRRLLAYNFNLTNSFTLGSHLTAQLSGYYSSPSIQGFYQSLAYYAVSAGATLKVLKDKGVLSISLADLLYTERGAADIHYQQQDFGFYRRNDTRLLRLAFTYKLGNTGLARREAHEGAAQEERSRAH